MKDGKEIERRFVVRSIDPDFRRAPSRRLVQGYFDTSPFESLRVRILDDTDAVITRKYGSGLSRDEKECAIPEHAARMLLSACGGNILRKTRYVRDGWEIDEFDTPLSGLILAEYEMSSEDEEVTLPPWISDAVEVTHSLTNRHLARLANDLRQETPDRPVREMLPQRVPWVVVTGGPCSGKSTLIKSVHEQHGDTVHCVPEVATIVISQVGITPPLHDDLALRQFQRTLALVQRSFEDVSNDQAIRDGKRLLLLDRGIMDAAAYLPDGILDLESILGTNSRSEYERYDHVLYLETPPEDVYETNKANNPARSETYALAKELGDRIFTVWSGTGITLEFGHPKLHTIRNGASWEEKQRSFFSHIDAILAGTSGRKKSLSGYCCDNY